MSCLTLCKIPSSECFAIAVRKSNGVLVPVICIPCTTHHSKTELGRRSSATRASVSLAVTGLEKRDQLLCLARPHLLERHVEPRIRCGHRDNMLDAGLECRG